MPPKDPDPIDTGPLSALLAAAGSADEYSELEDFDVESAEEPAAAAAVDGPAARPSPANDADQLPADPHDTGPHDANPQDVDAFEVELDEAEDPLYDHTADEDEVDGGEVGHPGPPHGRELGATAPAGPSRPSRPSHSAAAAATEGWRRAVPVAIIAVGAVVVGIAVADAWPGGNPPPVTQSAGLGPKATSSSVTLPGVIGASGTPAAGGAVTGTIPARATSPAAGPSVASASAAVAAGTATVTVLNQTAVKDLGGTEGKRISAAGWKVRRITDVRARESVTTVFYDDGQKDQAQLLLKTVPTVRRAERRPLWLLRTGGLIVVVADDAS